MTEPNTGLNTLKLKTMAVRDGDRYVVNGQKVWISTAQVAAQDPAARAHHADRGGHVARQGPEPVLHRPRPQPHRGARDREAWAARRSIRTSSSSTTSRFRSRTASARKGNGFSYILHGMNPERVLLAAEAIGLGRAALRRAANYANERIVFDRPIGKNQGVQHPLAERWMELEAGTLLYQRAAWLYDQGMPCGAEANAAKFFCAGSRISRLRNRGADARRLRLRQGVPRRALPARGDAAAHRAGLASADPVLHRREGARPAEVLRRSPGWSNIPARR